MSTEQMIAAIGIPIIGAMATAITVLYKQLMASQKRLEGILRETVQCFATVAELQRVTNTLLVEVKDTMLLCQNKEG
jgi:hypothetical protein